MVDPVNNPLSASGSSSETDSDTGRAIWFADETVRWEPTKTIEANDVTRWAIDHDNRIWMTTIAAHPSASAGADPLERRLHPAILLENAVRSITVDSEHGPFPWDVIELICNPGPTEDYLPVLGRGRIIINGRLYLGTTLQVDSSVFIATIVDGRWVGAFQPRTGKTIKFATRSRVHCLRCRDPQFRFVQP